jgi:VWFA-related protein
MRSWLVAGVLAGMNGAAIGQMTPASVPTLRANTRLVVVDVVVQDGKGNPLHGVAKSELVLKEDGAVQTVAGFEEHSGVGTAVQLAPMPKLEKGSFTNYQPAPVSGAVNILLLDALNTPMKDQSYVRDQMLKYLKTPRPGARMAIFALTTRLRMLQGLTTDPEMLRAALDGKKGLPKGSPLMDNAVSGDQPGQDTAMSQLEEQMSANPALAGALANLQQFDAEVQSTQTMQRAKMTLDALNAVARYLSSMPGRKNLIWFSGSFPVNILPDSDLTDPFATMASVEEEYRDTVNLLSRSQVSVYPVDARGLMVAPLFNAENSGSKYARNPQSMGKDLEKFSQQQVAEHATMEQMANDTGGRAFFNTNGLKEAVEKAVDAGSNYYTLAYTPTNREWKGEYRKIEVSLERAGYKLAYRRGYFADETDERAKKGVASATVPVVPLDSMHAAMLWGGPQPTEILFSATVRPTTGETEADTAKGTQAEAGVNGPFRRFTVFYQVSPRNITATPMPDGTRHVEARFITMTYDDQGMQLTSAGTGFRADLSAANYKLMMQGGLQYRQEISVPLKASQFLRIGVQDIPSKRVGAVEFPIEAVAKLKTVKEETAVEMERAKAAGGGAPATKPEP